MGALQIEVYGSYVDKMFVHNDEELSDGAEALAILKYDSS